MSKDRPRYIPTLDGWRALAVLAVILYHERVLGWGRWNDDVVHHWGNLGVDLFFGISGLLICSKLLEEDRSGHGISLKTFYLRRSFRILPALWFCLLAILILGVTHSIPFHAGSWFASLAFVNNYLEAARRNDLYSPYTNHLWSLAVEEHFYLLLPLLLAMLRGTRARVAALTLLSVAGCVWTNVYFSLHRSDPLRAYASSRSDLKLYELFYPSLLAVLLTTATGQKWLRRICVPLPIMAVTILASWAATKLGREGAVHMMVAPFLLPLLILSTTFQAHGWLGRFLESRPLRAVGRLSYSLYLWQQLLFVQTSSAGWLGVLQRWPIDVPVLAILACFSYYCIEQPMIRLGRRMLWADRASA